MTEGNIEEIEKFINEVAENGCPPDAKCENYVVGKNIVDCQQCLRSEIEKLLSRIKKEL